MASKRRSKCRNCRELFKADARNRRRKKYCSKASCSAASKAQCQRRWLARRRTPITSATPRMAALRHWQRAHPGNWRNTGRYKRRTLQEPWRSQAIDRTVDVGLLALQDAMRQQGPVLIGLIATLTDSSLQEDMVASSRRLLQLGQDILGGKRRDAHQAGATP